jgi:hypothetical protein
MYRPEVSPSSEITKSPGMKREERTLIASVSLEVDFRPEMSDTTIPFESRTTAL